MPTGPTADLVLRGGDVWTLGGSEGGDEHVSAIAIDEGVVVAVGTAEELESRIGPETRVIELDGATVLPGLTDAHAHLTNLGLTLETVDLRGAASIDEVVRRVQEGAPKEGWIIGRGWDQNRWPASGGAHAMPTHDALSAAFPDRPVVLSRVDGHAVWVNEAAMRASGITRSTQAPRGGEILRDRRGEPTGVFVDAAEELIVVPPPSVSDVERRLLAAQAHAVERGLTGVHDMGLDATTDRVLRDLEARGLWKLRVHGYASEAWFLAGLDGKTADPIAPASRYVLAGVKVYVDGALGSRGAALHEDYADRPGHRGLLQNDPEHFVTLTSRALDVGLQVASHAIGDRGNTIILDAYAKALTAHPSSQARLRVEHAQVVDPADIPRFAELGVIASMQPTHATSDMPWVPARLGATRLDGVYAWRRMLDAGVVLAFGSDAPVESIDPRLGLYAAVTRMDDEGKPPGGWLPDQRLRLHEAIDAFTRGAAFAAHREAHLGRLVPGMQADLTVFAVRLDSLDAPALPKAPLRATIIAGEVVWEAK
jgi:predicted amidohydrolase YtcJ